MIRLFENGGNIYIEHLLIKGDFGKVQEDHGSLSLRPAKPLPFLRKNML